MNENQGLQFLDILAIVSFAMQVMNQQHFANQRTNNDIMRALQKQDSEYLQVIIEQNNHIIDLLETFLGRSAQST